MISFSRSVLFVAGVAAIGTGAAFDVMAQTASKTTTVTSRPRPELDPQGMRMGSFQLFPTLDVTGKHDDNIFRTETGEVDDYILEFKPSVRLNSNWNNHALNFNASTTIGRYADNDAEDYEDYSVGVDGRIDVTRRADVTANASFQKLHEERGSADDANGVNPTEYTVKRVGAAFGQQFNRVKARIGANFAQYDYDDVRTSSGTTVNNDDRDRDETEIYLRVGYEITPEYEGFIRLSANDKDYDLATDDNSLNRDSDGYEARAGVRLDLGGVAFGDVFLGYQSQSYDDPSFSKIDGVSYGAALTWNATQLTTARLDVSRTIGETTQNNVSGTRTSKYEVTVDHELLRNLLIGAKAGFANTEYQGSTREDDDTIANVFAKYMLSRYLYLSADYRLLSRDSSTAGNDYDANVFFVRITGQL